METLPLLQFRYQTSATSSSFPARLFPTFFFYVSFLYTVVVSALQAKRNRYTEEDWALSSYRLIQALERSGVVIEASGFEHLQQLTTPCVIIANHESMMETIILPAVILPIIKIAFIIKESLLHYPVFKFVMCASNPIAVTRTNPRQDLKTVMEEGSARLRNGISVIVFPQTTRSSDFNPQNFNSIGVKLAQKTGVPVIALALKTDAWSNGNLLKDFGRILPRKRVHLAFSPPISVTGKGQEAQQAIISFIQAKRTEWHEPQSL